MIGDGKGNTAYLIVGKRVCVNQRELIFNYSIVTGLED